MAKKIPQKVQLVWESKIKQTPSKNKHISYSQLSQFSNCERQWYLNYVKKLAPYQPSIHAMFGTAFHETVQTWLTTLYHDKVKNAEAMDLEELLLANMKQAHKVTKAQSNWQEFTTSQEMQSFYEDGLNILKFLKSKRGAYFSTKGTYLAGVETLLYQELRPGVQFKGYIDLVFYNEISDTWTLVDIKTSTSGWNDYAKKDLSKTAQLLLYKEFFSKQFDIPIEKIEVEYFIVKRKVNENAEWETARRRVQQFSPPSGKIKMGQALKLMENFVSRAVDDNGEYFEKEYPTNPSKNSCRFCPFRENKTCPDAIN